MEIAQFLVGTEESSEVAEMNGAELSGEAGKLIGVLFSMQHPQMEHQAL